MATIANLSVYLKLNEKEPLDKKNTNVFLNPLPYSNFKGFMGLPLQMPIIFNVSALIASIQSIGIGISSFLFIYGWGKNTPIFFCSKITIQPIEYSIATAAVFSIIAFLICYFIFKIQRKEINKRTKYYSTLFEMLSSSE